MKLKFLLVLLICSPFFSAFGQKIDIDKFTKDTQKTKLDSRNVRIIWWIPTEFWGAILQEDPTITSEGIQQIARVVNRYSIFAVVDGELGPFGGFTSMPEEEIRENIKIRLPGGKRLTPLPELQLSSDVKNFFSMKENLADTK